MGSENKFEVLLIAELQKLIDKLESHIVKIWEKIKKIFDTILSVCLPIPLVISLLSPRVRVIVKISYGDVVSNLRPDCV